jgi:hypothetical protein
VRDAVVLALAIVAGLFLLGYDRRTDDTGVEAALLLAIIPVALVITLAGALLGYLMRRGSLAAH